MVKSSEITKSYEWAKEKYAGMGVDVEKAIETLEHVSISIHCWQGDDVGGFEKPGAELEGGGIQVTGNFKGKARTIDELRMDLDKVYSLIPGKHRLNLHAIYGEFGGKKVDRNKISTEHFSGWTEWVKERGLGLDFNSTCFSHPKADSGFTLSSTIKGIRDFWIEHVIKCREIASYIGKNLENPCIHNLWIPDGMKDTPVDRWIHRLILKESLDEIYATQYDPSVMKDSLESKLFGIGSESYVVGSHEFYMNYAQSNGKMICLDMGHFHPTESVADKISSLLLFFDELLIHVSRGVRWDSDHVVIQDESLQSLADEIVRGEMLDRVHIALDYFDASMNRVGAWAAGARSTLKSFLNALLEPIDKLRDYENNGNYFARLDLIEEMKSMPLGAVWDYYCMKNKVPIGVQLMEEVMKYEKDVLEKRI